MIESCPLQKFPFHNEYDETTLSLNVLHIQVACHATITADTGVTTVMGP
jgi:hypothetical protein